MAEAPIALVTTICQQRDQYYCFGLPTIDASLHTSSASPTADPPFLKFCPKRATLQFDFCDARIYLGFAISLKRYVLGVRSLRSRRSYGYTMLIRLRQGLMLLREASLAEACTLQP